MANKYQKVFDKIEKLSDIELIDALGELKCNMKTHKLQVDDDEFLIQGIEREKKRRGMD